VKVFGCERTVPRHRTDYLVDAPLIHLPGRENLRIAGLADRQLAEALCPENTRAKQLAVCERYFFPQEL